MFKRFDGLETDDAHYRINFALPPSQVTRCLGHHKYIQISNDLK